VYIRVASFTCHLVAIAFASRQAWRLSYSNASDGAGIRPFKLFRLQKESLRSGWEAGLRDQRNVAPNISTQHIGTPIAELDEHAPQEMMAIMGAAEELSLIYSMKSLGALIIHRQRELTF